MEIHFHISTTKDIKLSLYSLFWVKWTQINCINKCNLCVFINKCSCINNIPLHFVEHIAIQNKHMWGGGQVFLCCSYAVELMCLAKRSSFVSVQRPWSFVAFQYSLRQIPLLFLWFVVSSLVNYNDVHFGSTMTDGMNHCLDYCPSALYLLDWTAHYYYLKLSPYSSCISNWIRVNKTAFLCSRIYCCVKYVWYIWGSLANILKRRIFFWQGVHEKTQLSSCWGCFLCGHRKRNTSTCEQLRLPEAVHSMIHMFHTSSDKKFSFSHFFSSVHCSESILQVFTFMSNDLLYPS